MPLVIVAALLMFLPARAAFADGCTALGGDVVGTECQLSASVNKSGTFNIDQQTFRILPGGKITVPVAAKGNTLEINVCVAGALPTCDFIMEAGAEIRGDVTGTGTATGVGATININATGRIELQGDGTGGALISSNQTFGSCTAGGRAGSINLAAGFDITTEAGSVISANGTPCPGGSIKLISAQGNVTTAGVISSVSTMSGTGAQQFPGGGPITIIARCKATVGGTVESRGGDAERTSSTSRLCLRLQRGCGVRGWGRDDLGTGARGRGARARRALMSTTRSRCGAMRESRGRWASTDGPAMPEPCSGSIARSSSSRST